MKGCHPFHALYTSQFNWPIKLARSMRSELVRNVLVPLFLEPTRITQIPIVLHNFPSVTSCAFLVASFSVKVTRIT